MKFLRFSTNNKNNEFGIIKENRVYSINQMNLSKEFTEFNDFIKYHTDDDLNIISEYSDSNYYILDDIQILSPFKNTPHDIICVGLNYEKHIQESKQLVNSTTDLELSTTYFSKRSEIILSHNDVIAYDKYLDSTLDYENELAIIIGKKGKNISVENAIDHVFGFTIINDFSARDLQKSHNQWFKGKSLDGYLSMGPFVVHKNFFDFPLNLKITTKVNSEIRQSSNTMNMIKNVSEIISDFSKGITLVPGDIISTGTPEGVGIGYTPPKYLKDGDIVECFIEGIGTLKNKIKNTSL